MDRSTRLGVLRAELERLQARLAVARAAVAAGAGDEVLELETQIRAVEAEALALVAAADDEEQEEQEDEEDSRAAKRVRRQQPEEGRRLDALAVLALERPDLIPQLRAINRSLRNTVTMGDPFLRVIQGRPSEAQVMDRLRRVLRESDYAAHRQAPLRFCIAQGFAECVDFLLARPNVAVSIRNFAPVRSALIRAMRNPTERRLRILQRMLDRTAEVSKDLSSPLYTRMKSAVDSESRVIPIPVLRVLLPAFTFRQLVAQVGMEEMRNFLAAYIFETYLDSYLREGAPEGLTREYLLQAIPVMLAEPLENTGDLLPDAALHFLSRPLQEGELKSMLLGSEKVRQALETEGWAVLGANASHGPNRFYVNDFRNSARVLVDNFPVTYAGNFEWLFENMFSTTSLETIEPYGPTLEEIFAHPKVQAILAVPAVQESLIRLFTADEVKATHESVLGIVLLNAIRPLVSSERFADLLALYISFEDI